MSSVVRRAVAYCLCSLLCNKLLDSSLRDRGLDDRVIASLEVDYHRLVEWELGYWWSDGHDLEKRGHEEHGLREDRQSERHEGG